MKKFTLLLTLAFIATFAFAQNQYRTSFKNLNRAEKATQYDKIPASMRSNVVGMISDGVTRLDATSATQNKQGHKTAKKAAAKMPEELNTDVIREQPEGEVKTYSRSGGAFALFFGYIIQASQNGMVIEITYAPDGKTVYLKDPVAMDVENTWIKGTIEGNKIHIPLYQMVGYDEYGGYGVFLAKLDINDNGNNYIVDETATEATYTINEDGTISLDGYTLEGNGIPDSILGLAYSDDKSWSGLGDYNTVFTEFNDVATTMPAGLTPETWSFMWTRDGYRYGRIVNAAIDGDKIYIEGLDTYDKESVIVGTINGDKATFESDQYLGSNSSSFLYFCGANFTIEQEWDEYMEEYFGIYNYTYLPELVFNYDADKKTLTSADDIALIINGGKGAEEISTWITYYNPTFGLFKDVAATPATPEVVGVNLTFENSNYDMVSLNVKTEDVNGNFINPNNLKYILWVKVDGEPEEFVFYADEYFSFADDNIDELIEVPYNFIAYDAYGWEDIDEGGSTICLYQTGFDDYGVQSIYYGGGECHKSEISWYNLTDIKGVTNNKTENKVSAVYSIDGKRLSTPQKGINILKMANGSVRKVMVK